MISSHGASRAWRTSTGERRRDPYALLTDHINLQLKRTFPRARVDLQRRSIGGGTTQRQVRVLSDSVGASSFVKQLALSALSQLLGRIREPSRGLSGESHIAHLCDSSSLYNWVYHVLRFLLRSRKIRIPGTSHIEDFVAPPLMHKGDS